MPMNDLLAQHQLAQLNANAAMTDEERERFADLESLYASKIDAWRAALELPNEGWPGGAEAMPLSPSQGRQPHTG